jgi:hypothetical protein
LNENDICTEIKYGCFYTNKEDRDAFMEDEINSGNVFRDWFGHKYIPIQENGVTVRYNIELRSGTTIDFQPTVQQVKLNLLESKKGSLD